VKAAMLDCKTEQLLQLGKRFCQTGDLAVSQNRCYIPALFSSHNPAIVCLGPALSFNVCPSIQTTVRASRILTSPFCRHKMPENGTQTRPAGSPRDGNGAHEPLRELQAQPLDAYLDDQQQFADGMPDDTVSESSVSSVSTWTDFTHRYSWNWEPDCCLKIRKRWVPCLLEVEHTFWQFGMQRDNEFNSIAAQW